MEKESKENIKVSELSFNSEKEEAKIVCPHCSNVENYSLSMDMFGKAGAINYYCPKCERLLVIVPKLFLYTHEAFQQLQGA